MNIPADLDIESLFSVFDTPEFVPEPFNSDQCKNCKKLDGILENVCTFCGFDEPCQISQEAEWRSGVSEDGVAHDPCRVGMAADPLYSSSWGRATMITTNFKNRQKYGLAARINFHSSMNHRDRALHKAYGEFETIGKDILKLPPSIISHAKGYYKKFSETVLTRGAVRTGIKANCIFWACKLNKVPRTTTEIATAFGISTNDISRTFEKATSIINPQKNTIIKPADMVSRIFSSLGIELTRENSKLKMMCCRLCEVVAKCPKLMGKTPNAVAVVVIYRGLLGTPIEVSRDTLADKAGVSVATINKLNTIVKGIMDNISK